ncbi:MAG: RNA pyrophosphohydrolase [Hyphomonadaceae bacterium]
MSEEAPLYRACVGLALFHPSGVVFLGKRQGAPSPYQWQMPQGGIDAGESAEAAALRELEEETGAPRRLVEILEETPDWLTYDFPPEVLAQQRSRGRFIGQRQKWFALRFHGRDSDIRLDVHTPEFSDWRWAPLDQAVQLVIPFKRAVYEEAARRFGKYAAGEER